AESSLGHRLKAADDVKFARVVFFEAPEFRKLTELSDERRRGKFFASPRFIDADVRDHDRIGFAAFDDRTVSKNEIHQIAVTVRRQRVIRLGAVRFFATVADGFERGRERYEIHFYQV